MTPISLSHIRPEGTQNKVYAHVLVFLCHLYTAFASEELWKTFSWYIPLDLSCKDIRRAGISYFKSCRCINCYLLCSVYASGYHVKCE